MPAKDRYHDTVKRTLINNGWMIIDEQVKIEIGRRRLWIDVQDRKAKQNLAILVEIKGFENSPSSVEELFQALGQYVVYQVALMSMNSPLPLYLAVPRAAYDGILSEPLGQGVIKQVGMKLMVFDPIHEEIALWLH